MRFKNILFLFLILVWGQQPVLADPDSLQSLSDTLGKMSKYCKDAADKLDSNQQEQSKATGVKVDPKVEFFLSSPAGKSPKSFSRGWPYRARCLVGGRDYSEYVAWSGSGSFNPQHGALCYPNFPKAGPNTITLSILVNGKRKAQSFNVVTVDPSNYARVGTRVICSADVHAGVCPACPHSVIGKILSGSSTVSINGMPAARVGDVGKHCCCCGPNRFTIESGDSEVLIDGLPAARINDRTRHCGGIGTIVGGDLTQTELFAAIPADLPVSIRIQKVSQNPVKKGEKFYVICLIDYSGDKKLEQFLDKKLTYRWSTGQLSIIGKSESGNTLVLSSPTAGKQVLSCTVSAPNTLELYEMNAADCVQNKYDYLHTEPRIIGKASATIEIAEADLNVNEVDPRMLGEWFYHMGDGRMPTNTGGSFALPIRMPVTFRADGTVISSGASGKGARWQKSGNKVRIEAKNGFEEYTLSSDGNTLFDSHGVARYLRFR